MRMYLYCMWNLEVWYVTITINISVNAFQLNRSAVCEHVSVKNVSVHIFKRPTMAHLGEENTGWDYLF